MARIDTTSSGTSTVGAGGWAPRGVPGGGAAVPLRAAPAPRLPVARRRRRVPYLLVGVMLILTCAVVFYVASVRASGKVPVLVLARDVTAGQVLTAADLRVAQVALDGQVGSVPAGRAASMVGARMAVPRPAGALLAGTDVGPVRFPAPGKAVVAVALKAGQFPPGLAPGTSVAALMTTPSNVAAGGATGRTARAAGPAWVDAEVVSLTPDTSGTTVVALLMNENSATALGAAPAGTVTLLQLSTSHGG